MLTCAHVLDVPCHAHDQASVRKVVDELPAPALIFRGRYSRRDLARFDCAHANNLVSATFGEEGGGCL